MLALHHVCGSELDRHAKARRAGLQRLRSRSGSVPVRLLLRQFTRPQTLVALVLLELAAAEDTGGVGNSTTAAPETKSTILSVVPEMMSATPAPLGAVSSQAGFVLEQLIDILTSLKPQDVGVGHLSPPLAYEAFWCKSCSRLYGTWLSAGRPYLGVGRRAGALL